MSKRAKGMISTALELWPSIQRSIGKDPLVETIENEGFRGKDLEDLDLPE